MNHIVELRASYRYIQEHPWTIQGITGFLSAYFMENPGFQVQKHFDELETGIHVWICEVPPNMKFGRLLRRLEQDIPPCRYGQVEIPSTTSPQFLIDSPDIEYE